MRGLFINNEKAKDSIYESGFMAYNCLKLSDKFSLDYCEISIDNRHIRTGYDFYFFNYHPVTMNWLGTRDLKKLGFVITMILEVAPGDAFVLCPDSDFHLYCALDPTIVSKGNLYSFPRPLEAVTFDLPESNNEVPVIGTFGFATRGKGFQHVVEAVSKEFDKALVKINIPYGSFVPDSKEYAEFITGVCKQKAKEGIELQVTHDFMSKEELIRWCASNTLNCFLYDRDMPGLAATTDQAISSGRPLAVSSNDTFRHILTYLKPYPEMSLKASIAESAPLVNKMKEDWAPDKFSKKFETVLLKRWFQVKGPGRDKFELPLKTKSFGDSLRRKVKKYKKKLLNINFKKTAKRKPKNEVI